MRRIGSSYATTFSVSAADGRTRTDCDPLGDHRLTVAVRRPHWWSSQLHVDVSYTGYKPLQGPQPEPEPEPKPPLDGYAVLLNDGGQYNIVADDWGEDPDSENMLNFYIGDEFAASFRYIDVKCFIRARAGEP